LQEQQQTHSANMELTTLTLDFLRASTARTAITETTREIRPQRLRVRLDLTDLLRRHQGQSISILALRAPTARRLSYRLLANAQNVIQASTESPGRLQSQATVMQATSAQGALLFPTLQPLTASTTPMATSTSLRDDRKATGVLLEDTTPFHAMKARTRILRARACARPARQASTETKLPSRPPSW